MSNDNESYIGVSNGKTRSFVGPDAVALFANTALVGALRLYAKTRIKANRAYTPTNMLRRAGEITGKHYKRTQLLQAADDVEEWCNTMKAALPIVDDTPKRSGQY